MAWKIASRASSPAVSASASPWPAPSSASPRCCSSTNSRLRLAPDVEVRIPTDEQLAGLHDLFISIRPEKIHLQKTKPAGDNCFEAEVDDELFKGATDELSLKTAGGLELTAVVANES